MNSSRNANRIFWILIVGGAAFIWHSRQQLPERVASHFDANGIANGFMTRDVYISFMLAMSILLPLFLNWIMGRSMSSRLERINIPHREYWLAPERQAETIAFLQVLATRFATQLLAFLIFVHGVVLLGNSSNPPQLPMSLFWGGLSVFIAASLLMLLGLWRRFKVAK